MNKKVADTLAEKQLLVATPPGRRAAIESQIAQWLSIDPAT
jgi:hypothetical protein